MRRPVKVMEKVANLLEDDDVDKFVEYIETLTEAEAKAALMFAINFQDLMMDTIARIESKKTIILPQ